MIYQIFNMLQCWSFLIDTDQTAILLASVSTHLLTVPFANFISSVPWLLRTFLSPACADRIWTPKSHGHLVMWRIPPEELVLT